MFKSGEILVLILIFLKEGVDILEIFVIIFVGGGKSDIMMI